MGIGEKTANRRALIDMVRDCIKQVNAMTTLVSDVREANNALAAQTGEDVAALKARLDTLGAWCSRLETAASREAKRLTSARLDGVRVETRLENLTLMSFWQRWRWLLTGHVPMLSAAPEMPANGLPPSEDTGRDLTPDERRIMAADAAATAEAFHQQGLRNGYIPHTSLGPKVLP